MRVGFGPPLLLLIIKEAIKMALATSKYIKYDMDLQEYYINLDTITNYTTYSDGEIRGILGKNGADVNKAIKVISHAVYRLIYDQRRAKDKFIHKKYMRKKIYDNAQEEVTVLMLGMVEAVKGAIESGMDLNAYIDNPKDVMPPTVYQELRQADLLDPSEKRDYDLDFTYTAGEISEN